MDSLIPGETTKRNEVWWERLIVILQAEPATAGKISLARKGFPFKKVTGHHYIVKIGDFSPTFILQVRHLYVYLDEEGNQLPEAFLAQDALVRLFRTVNSGPLPGLPTFSLH